MQSFDDLWTPDKALPDGLTLRLLAGRVLDAWGHGDLAAGIRFGYNGRLRSSLGRAFYKENRIDLNPRLLGANPQQVISTLVHELAHIVVYRRHGQVDAHGLHFRALMAQAGFKGRATVKLAVNPSGRTRRLFLYLHICSLCGQRFIARRVRRDCYCRHCGPTMEWKVLRAPNTPEGLKILEGAGKA